MATVGASGLLSILFPNYFGTVDQFAVKALRGVKNLNQEEPIKRMNPEGLKIEEGVVLLGIMRSKAAALNQQFKTERWTPRLVDMILWTYGR